jgi:hypothetical protein
MEASGLVAAESIGLWLFNVMESEVPDPTRLSIAWSDSYGVSQADTLWSTRAPGDFDTSFKADGDGFFDILFDFPPSPGGDERFQPGEWVQFTITHEDGVTLAPWMFRDPSVGALGLFTAAHIQGIDHPGVPGIDDEGSGWVTIPAPGAALLGVIGLLGLRWAKRHAA